MPTLAVSEVSTNNIWAPALAAAMSPDVLPVLVARAYYSMPDPLDLFNKDLFTLAELQHFHELVLGQVLPRAGFARRMERSGLLEETGLKTRGRVGKPARLFRKIA